AKQFRAVEVAAFERRVRKIRGGELCAGKTDTREHGAGEVKPLELAVAEIGADQADARQLALLLHPADELLFAQCLHVQASLVMRRFAPSKFVPSVTASISSAS